MTTAIDLDALRSGPEVAWMTVLVEFMRAKGVAELERDGMRLVLGPEVKVEEKNAAAKPERELKKGRDGLTAEEQVVMYGRRFDAEEG